MTSSGIASVQKLAPTIKLANGSPNDPAQFCSAVVG
jgi:hypothetical protein